MKPKPKAPPTAAEIALAGMTREQMTAVLQLDSRTSVPGIFRASDDALRSAILTYLRLGRLTEQQVIEGAK